MKAVILAGGKGTRMLPLTYTRPKALLPLANRPIMQHLVDALLGLPEECAEIDEIIIVTNYLEECIRDYFAAADYEGRDVVKISFVHQAEPLGTGDALKAVAGMLKDDFILINGDETFGRGDIMTVVDAFKARQAKAVIAAASMEKPGLYGVLVADADGRLRRIIEKGAASDGSLVSAGMYVLSPDIFSYVARLTPSLRGEYELTDALTAMAEQTNAVFVRKVDGWFSVSMLWDLLEANTRKLRERIEAEGARAMPSADGKGKYVLGANVVIKSGVVIEGNVIIGDGSVIGPNCYIRGDTSIGRNCHVGNGCEIKNSIVMDDSKVPHLSYVGDSVIGEHCNLGAGTVVGNLRHDNRGVKVQVKDEVVDSGMRKLGFFMADYTKTGVNTSIYPGMTLGPFAWTAPSAVVDRNLEPFMMIGPKGKTRIAKEKIGDVAKEEADRKFLEKVYDDVC
ncbi:MAG: sugar phosphate nucleotidyltransferase [Candidatus Aenigmarchaeota archaeon]|nr:sugar phosphate nucleotidyltransferase [Candidatus Aenigmarchaeota archaeon]